MYIHAFQFYPPVKTLLILPFIKRNSKKFVLFLMSLFCETRVAFQTSLLAIFMFFCLMQTSAQTSNSEVKIRTIDMRGQSPMKAMVMAIKNSRNDVVVVLIRGGDQELIDKTKAQMRALVHNGYDRIGVVLCDLNEEETLPVLAVFSDGTIYAVIKDAKSDTVTGWKIYSLVRDGYEDDLWPKMKSSDHVQDNQK